MLGRQCSSGSVTCAVGGPDGTCDGVGTCTRGGSRLSSAVRSTVSNGILLLDSAGLATGTGGISSSTQVFCLSLVSNCSRGGLDARLSSVLFLRCVLVCLAGGCVVVWCVGRAAASRSGGGAAVGGVVFSRWRCLIERQLLDRELCLSCSES